MRTASRLNSSLCISAISGLLDGEYCSQKTGTKLGQVQNRAFRCATTSCFTAGVTIFFEEALASQPCRASARPIAASALRSRPPAPSAVWHPTPSSPKTSLSKHKTSLRHPMLAAKISALRAGLVLLQYPNDLLSCPICFLNRPSSLWTGL